MQSYRTSLSPDSRGALPAKSSPKAPPWSSFVLMRFDAVKAETPRQTTPLTRLAAWARPHRLESLDGGLFAGAALAALDTIVRSQPAFAGVWRNRLALRAAAATVRL